ncbi:DNA excision repair protein ERCC-5 [Lampetra fluviatilis]
MGVKGLWTLLDSTGRPVDLESLKGKVLAVDVSIWMNQAVRGVRDRHGNPIKAAHLVTLFHRVCKLLFYGIKPVFVFDGAAPLLKRRTLDVRRQRKGDAERDSSRAAERLMKVLLKKEAVGAVLGRERVRSARGATDRTADADLFKLPALPQLPHSSSSEEEVEEVDEVGRADPATWRHQLQFVEDPGSVDVDSSDFKSLPSEIQHELLTDLREAHKRRRTLFQAMPEESVSFSNYQLAGLLQRSRLSRRIEGLQEEMSGSARAQGHEGLAGAGPGQRVESQRVVSEETSHYILIQGPREPEGPAASEGTAPASPGGSSKSERPPGTLGRSAWSPAPVRASEPSPANGARAGTPCGTHEGAEVTAVEGSPAVGAAAAAVVNRSSNRGAVAVAMGLGQEVIAVAKRLNEAVVQRRLGEEEAVVVKEHLEEKVVAMERNLSEEEVVIKEHLDEKVVAMVKEEVMKRSPGKEVVAVETKLSGDAFDVVKSPSENAITMQKRMDEKAVTTVTIQDAEVVVIERSLGDGTVGVEKSLSHGVVTMEKIIDRQGVATEKNLGEGAVVVKKNQDETAVAVAQSLDTEVVTMETSHAGSAGGRSGPHGVEGGGELDGGGRCGGVIAVAAGDPGSRPPLPTLEGPTGAASSDEDDEDFVEVSSVSDVGFERGEEEEEEKEEKEDKVEGLEGDAGISVAESGGPSRCDPVTPGEQSPSSPSIPVQPPSPAFSPMTQEDLESLQYDLSEEEQTLVSERGHQERMATTITEQMCFECQELLRMFGLPYMTAPGEAEAQCAALDLADRTHGTITDDSDIWLFGGRYVYKNFFNQNRHIDFYQLVDVQRHIGLDRTKLVNLAYLMGSDYTEGVTGVGGVTALEILNEFGGPGIEPLVTLRAWWDEAQKNRKLHARPVESKLKHRLRQLTLSEGFPNPAVARAYLEPATSTVAGGFSWGQPQLLSIAEFCQSRFGWEVKKTEELLRPVLKQLSATQSQSRIDSFFPVVHSEVRNIRSKRMMRAVTTMKRQEAQAPAEAAGSEPGPGPEPMAPAPAGGFLGPAADSGAARSNGSNDVPRPGPKRKRRGAGGSGETAAGACPTGKAATQKRAKRKPRHKDGSSSTSSSTSSSSGDEAACDFNTSGRTVTAQSAFRGRRGVARGGRRARAGRRR